MLVVMVVVEVVVAVAEGVSMSTLAWCSTCLAKFAVQSHVPPFSIPWRIDSWLCLSGVCTVSCGLTLQLSSGFCLFVVDFDSFFFRCNSMDVTMRGGATVSTFYLLMPDWRHSEELKLCTCTIPLFVELEILCK